MSCSSTVNTTQINAVFDQSSLVHVVASCWCRCHDEHAMLVGWSGSPMLQHHVCSVKWKCGCAFFHLMKRSGVVVLSWRSRALMLMTTTVGAPDSCSEHGSSSVATPSTPLQPRDNSDMLRARSCWWELRHVCWQHVSMTLFSRDRVHLDTHGECTVTP